MRFFILLLTVELVFSCSSTSSEKTDQDSTPAIVTKVPELKKGEVNDTYVVSDPTNSFSVYLPTSYDSTKKYPVVIFFDAHANGNLPLNNYKSIAEKWGYILVGSNASKNGLAVEMTSRIGNELVDEVKNTLNINPQEIILCGFSGGARVASNIAMTRTDVKGIICNSAAPQAPLAGKIFVGLAGLGDMNYLEMKKFNDGQASNTSPHELLVFDGKHEWAPVNMMEDALLIASISTINNNANSNIQDTRIDEMYRSFGGMIYNQADSIKKISCLISNNLLLTGLRIQKNVEDNYRIVRSDDSNIQIRKTDPCVKSDEAAWKAAEEKESQLQQELGSAIMQQDTTWWKTNADSYFETTKTGAEKFMRQRLRGYASLMCYSYANQAFKTQNLHAAEKLVAVYSIVDPTNSEWAYMRAQLYMQIGLSDAAISLLEKAVDLGFNDRTRLQNDALFAPLQSDARFSALFGKMK